uniref:Uncharacterized protein n=1 Tax=Ciona savignyi TaxID=51511 RepID=H2YV92_CIOSA
MELKRQKQQLQVKLGIQPDHQHVALTKANSNSLIELDHQSAVEFDVRPSSYPDLKQLAKPTESEDNQLTNSATNDCTPATNDHESAPNVHNTTTNPATTNDNAATNDYNPTTNEYNPISNDNQFANPSTNDHGSSTNDNKQVEMDNNSSEVGNELTVVFTTEKRLKRTSGTFL